MCNLSEHDAYLGVDQSSLEMFAKSSVARGVLSSFASEDVSSVVALLARLLLKEGAGARGRVGRGNITLASGSAAKVSTSLV